MHLNSVISEIDSTGRTVTKQAYSRKGWHYDIVFIEFTTSKNEFRCKDRHGEDKGILTTSFYDSEGGEIDPATGSASVVKTVMTIDMQEDVEIIGGDLTHLKAASGNAYLYVTASPHIPSASGGDKAFAEGLNLALINDQYKMDGRAAKFVKDDPQYLSHLLQVSIDHDPGLLHKAQIGIEFFIA